MNKKIIIALVGIASLSVMTGALFWGGDEVQPTPTPNSEAALPEEAPPGAAAAGLVISPPVCTFEPGWTAAYDYRSETTGVVRLQPGAEPITNHHRFTGTLAMEFLGDDGSGSAVLLGQFLGLNSEALKDLGEQVAAPFLISVGPGCEVRGFARHGSVERPAARSQQVAIHDLWFRASGPSEPAEINFENGVGVARATMTRSGNWVTRRIQSYPQSWAQKQTFRVTESTTAVQLGTGWLEKLESREGIAGGVLESALLSLKVERKQSGAAQVPASSSRQQKDYVWENLLPGDYFAQKSDPLAVPPAEVRYVEMMKDKTIDLAFHRMAEKVYGKENVEDQWHEMAGYLNGHPEEIEEFGRGLVQDDFPEELKGVSYLVLSKVVHPQARNTLLAIRGDVTQAKVDRTRASLALVTRKDVGVEVAKAIRQDALSSDPQDAYHSRNSLLHLGILGKNRATDIEVARTVREGLTDGLAKAGNDPATLAPALGAISNMGDVSLLPQVFGLANSGSVEVRAAAAQGFRGFAYAQTEDQVVAWLERETSPDVKTEIFEVVRHQLADAQRTAGPKMVHEALRHLALHPGVMARQSIFHIVGPLAAENAEVREVLVNQLAVEFRNDSGLFSQVAYYLTPDDITRGLSRMEEFAHQYGRSAVVGGTP